MYTLFILSLSLSLSFFLSLQGYNTGYPYKNMELLTPPLESGEPPPADHSLDVSLDGSPQMRVSRRSSSNDLESVVKQIKLQMRRIKGEREGLGKKTPKAIELENESETDKRNLVNIQHVFVVIFSCS